MGNSVCVSGRIANLWNFGHRCRHQHRLLVARHFAKGTGSLRSACRYAWRWVRVGARDAKLNYG